MLDGICCMEVYIKNLSSISFNMIQKCWMKCLVTDTDKKMSNENFTYAWRLCQEFIADV